MLKGVFLQRVIGGTLLLIVCVLAGGFVYLKLIESHAQTVDYEMPLSHFTEEERDTYESHLRYEISRHIEKYPECEYNTAVWKDADRHARWYVKHREFTNKRSELFDEWMKATADLDEFLDNFYLNMTGSERQQFANDMSEAERASLIAKLKDWKKQGDAAYQRYDDFKKKEPIEPKPKHTH